MLPGTQKIPSLVYRESQLGHSVTWIQMFIRLTMEIGIVGMLWQTVPLIASRYNWLMKMRMSFGTRHSSGSTSTNNITSSCPTQANPFDVTFQQVLFMQQFTLNNGRNLCVGELRRAATPSCFQLLYTHDSVSSRRHRGSD